MFNYLKTLVDKRRENLVKMLEDKDNSDNIVQQHQLYGAINELCFILDAISYFQDKTINQRAAIDDGNK